MFFSDITRAIERRGSGANWAVSLNVDAPKVGKSFKLAVVE